MARTPKATRGKLSVADIKASLAVPIDTPGPARRGRKPRSAETPAEPLATMDSDDVVAGAFDTDAGISAPSEKPARGRPGPKPKPRGVEAATPVQQVKRKPGRPRNPTPAPKPEPEEDVPQSAELASPVSVASEGAEGPGDTATDTASAGDAEPFPASPVRPAAQWDRAADTVQFDWAAIEQTASQDGPNQVMAKLLIAARAEGANSRWPL